MGEADAVEGIGGIGERVARGGAGGARRRDRPRVFWLLQSLARLRSAREASSSWRVVAARRSWSWWSVVALAMGAMMVGWAMSQARGWTTGGGGVVAFGDFVEGGEDAEAGWVEVLGDGFAAGGFLEIGIAAVFSREETGGKGEVGDDADVVVG